MHGLGRSDPDVDVVEGRATAGCRLIGARQSVDAAAVFEGIIRPDRFRNDHAASQTRKEANVQCHPAPFISDPRLLTVHEAQ